MLVPMLFFLAVGRALLPRPFVPVAAKRGTVRFAADHGAEAPLKRFLDDLQFLGEMRFITVGDTAILETVAEIDAVNFKDQPDGTTMATLKSTDASFEAHLRLQELKKVRMEATPKGDRTLYAIRFLDRDDEPALVCLLHANQGEDYDESTIEYWEGLRTTFGPEIAIA